MATPDLAKLRAALLLWFSRNARDLPWRARGQRRPDPYRVWVSEIMLQQTRVDTVTRYYEPFLTRFPDVASLAAASEDTVMAAWSGLGYYRRARLLHAGVRDVVAHYGGKVPRDAAARRALPGIGRYTAGAIGSIAFGQQEPIVDGNVMRVFARLFRIETPLGARATEVRLWQLAEALVRGPRPGDLNQALMELGALVCTKVEPGCSSCPVARYCAARAAGVEHALPIPKPKRAPRAVRLVAILATSDKGRRVWLQRGEGNLFGGLWNLPMAEGDGVARARTLLREAGLVGRLHVNPAAQFEHVLTHRRLQVTLFRGTAAAAAQPQLRAVGGGDLPSLGISTLTRKALKSGGFACEEA